MSQRTIRESVNHYLDHLPDSWDKAAFAFDDDDEIDHNLWREVVDASWEDEGKAWRRRQAFDKRVKRQRRIANFDLFTLFPIHERTSA